MGLTSVSLLDLKGRLNCTVVLAILQVTVILSVDPLPRLAASSVGDGFADLQRDRTSGDDQVHGICSDVEEELAIQ